MKIKGCVEEDFLNYKLPSMFIITSFCDFKCDIDSGESCCQNSSLADADITNVDTRELIEKYINNPITKAVVFGGLEPMDQLPEVYEFINLLRNEYNCKDTVVIYTGYTEEEYGNVARNIIADLGNIIIKYGRFVPYKEKHFDDVLGVYLSSPNQYAKLYE